jgi:hypothetical protein
MNRSYSTAQKEPVVKDMEAKLNELQQDNSTQQQQHIGAFVEQACC